MVSSAARVGSINVLLQVQTGQATAGIGAFANQIDRAGVRTQRAVHGIDRSVAGMNRTMSGLRSRQFNVMAVSALRASSSVERLRGILLSTSVLLGGFGGAFAIRSAAEYSDTWKTTGNLLRVVKGDMQDLGDLQSKVFDIAKRSRSEYEATAVLFARMSNASKRLGISQADVLRTTETIQKSFLLGGSTTVEAAQSARQLSQGIASNRLQGDELRSVLENPALGQLLAGKITDGDIGKLRKIAAAGELTADVLIKAFRDSSEEIDKMFAGTQQTISQAFVLVDNALQKYIGTSKGANASSRATINLLNAVAENFEGIADTLVKVGAAFALIYGGNRLNALKSWASGVRAGRIEIAAAATETQRLATAEVAAARTNMLNARLAVNKAYREGNLTAKQLARAENEAAAAVTRYRAAVSGAALATTELAAAQRSASASGLAMSAAGRAASAAWSFIGGPFGAALLGIGAVMYAESRAAQRAQEITDTYSEAIKKAGEASGGAAGGIRAASEALTKQADAAEKMTVAAQNVALGGAQSDLANILNRIVDATTRLSPSLADYASGAAAAENAAISLANKFIKGEMSAEELKKSLDDIARANPEVSGPIDSIQHLADQADAARGRVDAISEAIGALDGKTAQVNILMNYQDMGVGKKEDRLVPPLSDDRFNARFGQPYAKDWKELFPDLYKPEKHTRAPRKTADDRFDNDIQRTRDRIADMAEEQAALRLTYREQERRKKALDLTQTALRQVREEARRKGEQDWQNAQLAPEQVAEINTVAAAYADQADALRKAQDEMELRRDIIRGVFGDISSALEDGKITAQEWGDVLINVLDKVISKIEDDLADALAKAFSNSGGGGGGGGILGSLFGGIFGGGGGFTAFEQTFTSAPGLWDEGGYTGAGPKDKVAGYVHAGEYVMSKMATQRIGVGNLEALHQAATRGYADGGYVGGMADRIGAAAAGLNDNGPRALNDNRTYNIDARGAQRGVGEEIKKALEDYDRMQAPLTWHRVKNDQRVRG